MLRDCADADLLLVNSDFVKKTFVAEGYPADKVRVAYLGVREEFFDLKRDYRIDGPVRILFTGNFDIRKGVRMLLEAIRCCRRSGLDLRLELMGNLGNGASCLQPGDDIFFTHTAFAPLKQVAAAIAACRLVRLSHFRRRLVALRNGGRCRWFAHHYDRKLRLAAGAGKECDLRTGERLLTLSPKPSPGLPRTRGCASK